MLSSLLRWTTPYRNPLQLLNPYSVRTMAAIVRDQATASFKLVRAPRAPSESRHVLN